MANKRFWYDINETGCNTEFKKKQDVIDHFNMMCDIDKKEVEGCHVYRQWSNVETVSTYVIRFANGRCRLQKC